MVENWQAEIAELTAANPLIERTPWFEQNYLGRWVIAERLGDVLDVTDVDRAAKGLEAMLAATDVTDPRDTSRRAATLFGKDVFLAKIEAILTRLFD